MTAPKESVSRSLIGTRIGGICLQTVARTPLRLDRTNSERPIDLLPEVFDVDVNHIGATVVGEVPDVLDQIHPRQDLARVPHEVLDEGELLRAQVDSRIAAPHHPGGGIEHKVSDP